jgi:hypothetical protein
VRVLETLGVAVGADVVAGAVVVEGGGKLALVPWKKDEEKGGGGCRGGGVNKIKNSNRHKMSVGPEDRQDRRITARRTSRYSTLNTPRKCIKQNH